MVDVSEWYLSSLSVDLTYCTLQKENGQNSMTKSYNLLVASLNPLGVVPVSKKDVKYRYSL